MLVSKCNILDVSQLEYYFSYSEIAHYFTISTSAFYKNYIKTEDSDVKTVQSILELLEINNLPQMRDPIESLNALCFT